MKKVLALLLTTVMLLCCITAFAKEEEKVSLDNFTLVVDKAEKGPNKIYIRLLAIFSSQEDAARYDFFFQSKKSPNEELENIYRSLGRDIVVHALVQTESGEAVFGDTIGAYDGSFKANDAEKQEDGTWCRVLEYSIYDYSTDELGLAFALCLFDVKEATAFLGDVEQTLYAKFQ